MQEFEKAMKELARACTACIEAMKCWWAAIAKDLSPAIKIYLAPNSKIKHLALHSKKKRVRKKNIKRLLNTI